MEAKPLTLGYVGVGLMGLPMVQRLLKLGWRVRAYDIVAERIAGSGALRCGSASEAARDVDVVLPPHASRNASPAATPTATS